MEHRERLLSDLQLTIILRHRLSVEDGMKNIHPKSFRLGATAAIAVFALAGISGSGKGRPFNDPRSELNEALDQAVEPRDPACYTRTLASTGGALPRSPHTLTVRWIGYSNFELVYNGHILLLDAYYDRGGNYPPLGFKAADIKRADGILIGHGHFDHMSDAASVGAATGATVVGAPATTQKLATQPI